MKTWDQYWSTYRQSKAERWLIEQRNELLCLVLNERQFYNRRVLEVGCGSATNSWMLHNCVHSIECHCCDLSPVAVSQLPDYLHPLHCDCQRMPYPSDHFDIVFSAGLIEHFHDESKALAEIRRVVKPDGYVVTFVPARFSLWKLFILLTKKHGYEKSYTVASLEALFRTNGFKVDSMSGCDPFSFNGALMKFLDIQFDPWWKTSPLKSGYTELCCIAKK